jgi:mRNA interferase YafQ
VKLAKKRGKNIDKLMAVIRIIANGEVLAQKYCDHKLGGAYNNHRECHIDPDWLLIYKYTETTSELILTAVRTGSHSDLF